MEEMEKVLSESPLRTVEEAYAGVVADNTSTNRKAFKIKKEITPDSLQLGAAPPMFLIY